MKLIYEYPVAPECVEIPDDVDEDSVTVEEIDGGTRVTIVHDLDADLEIDGGKDIVQNPWIEGELTCELCGEKWEWTFEAGQEHYDLECPGCGETWTSEKEGQTDT